MEALILGPLDLFYMQLGSTIHPDNAYVEG